jgi:NADH-quinone oxidoreductase subunit J
MLVAPFLAAVQVMVYAGAIMVLIVFTIMLLNIRVNASKSQSHKIILGSIIGFFTLLNTAVIVFKSRVALPNGSLTGEIIKQQGHTELIGREMFTTFLLPFEITSILLLVAIVGAVILAKKKI